MTIERFRGKYFPFSNMYSVDNRIRTDQGILVPISEHAYMANRFADPEVHRKIALAHAVKAANQWEHALLAKNLAHQYIEQGAELTYDCDAEKVLIMRRVVEQKLARNTEILELPISTGEEDIYEGNDWGDRFWGVSPVGDNSAGDNHLGKIYMSIRSDNT